MQGLYSFVTALLNCGMPFVEPHCNLWWWIGNSQYIANRIELLDNIFVVVTNSELSDYRTVGNIASMGILNFLSNLNL